MKLLHRTRLAAPEARPEDSEGNVRVLTAIPPQQPMGKGKSKSSCYLVRDAHGQVVSTGTQDRREALRELSCLAVRGASVPLVLLHPDGSPTGDRIS